MIGLWQEEDSFCVGRIRDGWLVNLLDVCDTRHGAELLAKMRIQDGRETKAEWLDYVPQRIATGKPVVLDWDLLMEMQDRHVM